METTTTETTTTETETPTSVVVVTSEPAGGSETLITEVLECQNQYRTISERMNYLETQSLSRSELTETIEGLRSGLNDLTSRIAKLETAALQALENQEGGIVVDALEATPENLEDLQPPRRKARTWLQ